MSFAIIRTAKYQTNNVIKKIAVHSLREYPEDIAGLVPEHTHLNINTGATTSKELVQLIEKRISNCTRKPRPDANKLIEIVATASPEFFIDKTLDESKAYLTDCITFAEEYFGKDNVIASSIHFDEKTPHIHIFVVPLETSIRTTKHKKVEHTTLNAKHYLGSQDQMISFQDSFHKFVVERNHDLERGISVRETNRIHTPIREFHATKLKQVEQKLEHVEELETEYDLKLNELVSLREAHETNKRNLSVTREKVDSKEAALNSRALELDSRESKIVPQEKLMEFYTNKERHLKARHKEYRELLDKEYAEAVFKNANAILDAKHQAQGITPELKQIFDFVRSDEVISKVLHRAINEPDLAEKIRGLIDTEPPIGDGITWQEEEGLESGAFLDSMNTTQTVQISQKDILNSNNDYTY